MKTMLSADQSQSAGPTKTLRNETPDMAATVSSLLWGADR